MEEKSFCDITLHYEKEKDSEQYTIGCECDFKGYEHDKLNILVEIFQALDIDEHGNEFLLVLYALRGLEARRRREAKE